MTIKEKPLIDAVARLGALPGFLFSNNIFTGFFSMIMCAVFGAFTMLFQAAGRGLVAALELFEAVRWGAIAGLAIGVVLFIGVAISAVFNRDEAKPRLLFTLGGALAVATLAIIDRMTLETVRSWLVTAGPII